MIEVEALSLSETLVSIYQIIHTHTHNIPENSHLHKYDIYSSVKIGPNEHMGMRMFNMNTLYDIITL